MKKGKHHVGGGAAISDPRFAKVQSDPRFRRMPKDEAKASIDNRFSSMFTERRFAEPSAADKRGRAKKKKEKQLLHRYYKVGEGNIEPDAVKKKKKKEEEEEEDEEEEEEEEEEEQQQVLQLQQEEEEEEEDEEDEEEEEEDEEEEEKEEEEEDEEAISDNESSSSSSSSDSEVEEVEDARDEEAVPTAPGAETRRFAVMNMDWEHVKAVDLLMLMRSFQPKGGNVECVSVYPSDFGIEQMKKDEVHGPSTVFEDEDEDEEVDMEKLRAYEKNKLKYFYAVVECDSKETANHLYTQCDGLEFERTSNTLDLRFIPDEMTFTREARDVAREVQDGYKAPEYETRALQHSTVKLTWDDDEPTRVKALRKKFNADELNEMDFRAYLASESSEEEQEGEEEENPSSPERGEPSKSKKDKYRSLLLGETELPGQRKKKGDVDMEVTFHTGLSELSEKLIQKKEAKKRGDETVWEAYLRKKKEKKAQRKRSKNAKGSDDDYTSEEDVANQDQVSTHDDTGFDDPFFADAGEFPDEPKAKKSSKKDTERLKKREEKEQQKQEEEKSKAELELLLMDDQGAAARGFNLKSKKKKEKKKRKNKGDQEEEDEDKLATAELTDPRFTTLFTDHRYAIDPDNSQFWKSESHLKIQSASQRRKMQSESGGAATSVASEAANEDSQDRKRKAELSSLVRSLKRKASKK